jgi:hypothetical protein
LLRAQARELLQAEKDWRKLCQQAYKCQADAEKAFQGFNQKWKYHQAVAEIEPIKKYAHLGRPAAVDEPEITGYCPTGSVTVMATAVEEAKKTLGKFIVATNQTDPEKLPTKALLDHYTEQGVSVERGFRFPKDPLLLTVCF